MAGVFPINMEKENEKSGRRNLPRPRLNFLWVTSCNSVAAEINLTR